MAWKKIAEKNSIEKGKGKEFKVDDKRIAIFNQDKYYALDALCVHQDGAIAPGKLEGDIVECPVHLTRNIHLDKRSQSVYHLL